MVAALMSPIRSATNFSSIGPPPSPRICLPTVRSSGDRSSSRNGAAICCGAANAMAYASIALSVVFTVYFFRKLAAARTQIAAEW